MPPAYLLLVCVAVATAAPLVSISKLPPTKKPELPFCDELKIVTELKQTGITHGGAAVSSSTSARGSANTKCTARSPSSVKQVVAAGNSAVSANGGSVGEGLFKQAAKAVTEVKNTDEGASVQTGTLGEGITHGTAVSSQNAGANGGIKVKIAKLLKSKGGLVAIKKILQGTITSNSGHKGSGARDSVFKVLNQGGTEILFDQLTTPKPVTIEATKTKKSGW